MSEPMKKHTPGPWMLEWVSGGAQIFHKSGIACIATIHPGVTDDIGNEAYEANAKLVASAPDMAAQLVAQRATIEEQNAIIHGMQDGALVRDQMALIERQRATIDGLVAALRSARHTLMSEDELSHDEFQGLIAKIDTALAQGGKC